MKKILNIVKLTKKIIIIMMLLIVIFYAFWIYKSHRGSSLHHWHTWSGDELTSSEMEHINFSDYLYHEDLLFQDLKRKVSDKLKPEEKTQLNRFYSRSQVYPETFSSNWNRSFVLMPDIPPRGAAVLLHGLTDSPYSMRYMAQVYQQKGFIAVVPRLPGHGTAPGGLTAVDRHDWIAATHLAVREAVRLAGPDMPLHLIGYSNGAALALKYTLDSQEDNTLKSPQQLVLMSPMIGITQFARFAGISGLPSILPAFAKTAWLNIVPEFNPFKYNSFPVQAARQSWLLTQEIQQQIIRHSQKTIQTAFPPILTFQSLMDATVSVEAVVNSLYFYLPDNGSELVIFDVNRAANLHALFRPSIHNAINTLLPPAPRRFSTTIITNASANTYATTAHTLPAGITLESVTSLPTVWPMGMFSLSHVAIPFPPTDPLYGYLPTSKEHYGLNLGTMTLRGEMATFIVDQDVLMRVTSNPFFDLMMARVNQRIDCSRQRILMACLKAMSNSEERD